MRSGVGFMLLLTHILPKIMPQHTTQGWSKPLRDRDLSLCCHRPGPGYPRPVIMRTIIQLYVPRTLELDPGLRSPRRGIPNSQFENWCSKYWLLFPKVLSTMDYPGLTLSYSASDRWLNLLFVFLSPINDPGISRVTRLKEYRKCRTRYNAAQWIKVDERFIHGNLWLLAKVVYNMLMS